MQDPNDLFERFFKVIIDRQAYLNVLYLLLAFPLGIFYFVYLITGLSIGISLIIIWIGIPILLLVGAGWWLLAAFERNMAIQMLQEEIPPMNAPTPTDDDIWTRFKDYFFNPVTWKSALYLLIKFPLGILSFTLMVTFLALTAAFLSMPISYQTFGFFQPVVDFGFMVWVVDSLSDALTAMLFGFLLLPVTLWVGNGLAWVHAKLAHLLLAREPAFSGSAPTPAESPAGAPEIES